MHFQFHAVAYRICAAATRQPAQGTHDRRRSVMTVPNVAFPELTRNRPADKTKVTPRPAPAHELAEPRRAESSLQAEQQRRFYHTRLQERYNAEVNTAFSRQPAFFAPRTGKTAVFTVALRLYRGARCESEF